MPKVIVLGGGVGGLSAAHELVQRGFQVEVYEKQPTLWGGKARSMTDPATGLPGEHGFRFFPGFYKHLPDTMSRIPIGGGRFAADNLTGTTQIEMTQEQFGPILLATKMGLSLDALLQAVADFINSGLSIDETLFFAQKMYQIATSCQDRRLAEYEKIAWWDFIEAAAHSPAYQKILGEGMTRSLVAMQAQIASTRTVGDILLQLAFNGADGTDQPVDRVLNAPTNDAWLSPWVAYLQGQGVKLVPNAITQQFLLDGNTITGAVVSIDGTNTTVTGDYYVAAMPVEVMQGLAANLVPVSPMLGKIQNLTTKWMNGIQFYLKTDVPLDNGHCIYLDSTWALTSISQHQFWPNTNLPGMSNGKVNGVLSVDISDWEAPGDQVVKKPAEDCSANEIAQETWAQLKAHLNRNGSIVLDDSNLYAWHLDPDITFPRSTPINDANAEPLLVNLENSWQYRPTAALEIPNLFLASDYVQTYTDLACMEGANEAARRAVNAILTASGSGASPCQIWPLTEPAFFAPYQQDDQTRFNQGLPWSEPWPPWGAAVDFAVVKSLADLKALFGR